MNFKLILILEEGRKPKPFAVGLGMMGGGLLTSLGMVGWWWKKRAA